MKALIIPSGRSIPPFDEPVGDCFVLARPLRLLQEQAIAAAGLEVAQTPPPGEPYLVISDRTWITSGAIRRFLQTAGAPARLRVEDPVWLEITAPLQKLEAAGLYEVGLVPAGEPPALAALPPVTVELDIKKIPPPKDLVPFFDKLPAAVPFTGEAVHQIDHWTHVLRVNWLALAAMWLERRHQFRKSSLFGKLIRIAKVLLRARSLNRFRILAALSTMGRGTKIHPTAVVEASVLGDDVEIGPHALVRGSLLGDGVKISEHASVTYSVLAERTRVGRLGTANLCVSYPGATFAAGNGFQATLFGRDAFVAWSATIFDLSFGDPVKVTDEGRRVSSGMWFLGAVIGHRARIGGRVVLGYGAEIPNEGFVVAPIDDVLRSWEPGPGPHRVEAGKARPISSKDEG